jgi:hypothetical protein
MIWVTFVGEGRSGHTIISAILGSHPNGFIGEERKSISRWYRNSWSKDQILNDVLTSGMGKERKTKGFDEQKVLSYRDPLLFVGDKCGWDAVNEYAKRGAPKDILHRFGQYMDMPVKVIVSLRNPLDNVGAWYISPKYKRIYVDDTFRMKKLTRRYRTFHRAAVDIIEGTDYFLWHNELAILDPIGTIHRLSDWLGLPIDEQWAQYCAARIFKTPNTHKELVDWPKHRVEQMKSFINECSLLEYYR